jgi:hypothetical protein
VSNRGDFIFLYEFRRSPHHQPCEREEKREGMSAHGMMTVPSMNWHFLLAPLLPVFFSVAFNRNSTKLTRTCLYLISITAADGLHRDFPSITCHAECL